MEPKWFQNASPKGCQMELKSSKMDPEWAPEGFKMDPNWMSNHAGTKVFGSKLKSNKKKSALKFDHATVR